jgi:Septum formation
MAAPTELSGGSAPESVAPEPVAAESAAPEPTAPQPRVPEPAESELDEPTAAELDEHAGAGAGEHAWAELDEHAGAGAGEDVRRGRGVGWLVTAAVAVVVIGLAAAVGALAVTTHGFRPKTVVKYRPAAVFRLRVGDCINSSQNGLSVTILSCASPHDAEVFATFSLTGSSWPGSAAVGQQASSGCGDRMASYVNPALADASLTQEYVYPDRQAWQAGERTVVCEVGAASGQLTGSVRQAG